MARGSGGENRGYARQRPRVLAGFSMARMCLLLGAALAIVPALPAPSRAHGFAGKRFFPTTFAVDDPFVSDEFSLLVSHIKEPGADGEPPARTTGYSLEYSKRITPRFGLSIGQEFRHLDLEGAGDESGFGNLEVGGKYQLLISEAHEALFSFGIGAEIGDTGSHSVGAESFSVITPALFFGKGLGDLPESAGFFRPLAITGVVGPNIPTESSNTFLNEDTGEVQTEYHPTTLTWGFTIQYDLRYLRSFVKDVGLGPPFNRMSVLVEFPMETCLNRDCGGDTTGFVNPGVVWAGKKIQLGVAAQVPINSRTGDNVGVFGLLHFYIDDLFPEGLGRPIFP